MMLTIAHRICRTCEKERERNSLLICAGCLKKHCVHSVALTRGICNDCRAENTKPRVPVAAA